MLSPARLRLAALLLRLPCLLLPPAAAGSMQVGDEFELPGGCHAEVMGCFFDKKWDDCRFLAAHNAGCKQSATYQSGRDIPYFLPGCFVDPEHSGKTAPSPPPCDI
jgi:hypothetical protein